MTASPDPCLRDPMCAMGAPAMGGGSAPGVPWNEAALKRPRNAGGQPLDLPFEEMCT
jgi:hypothetical protein